MDSFKLQAPEPFSSAGNERLLLRGFLIEAPVFLNKIHDVRVDTRRFMFPACFGFFQTIEFSGLDIDGMNNKPMTGIGKQFP